MEKAKQNINWITIVLGSWQTTDSHGSYSTLCTRAFYIVSKTAVTETEKLAKREATSRSKKLRLQAQQAQKKEKYKQKTKKQKSNIARSM